MRGSSLILVFGSLAPGTGLCCIRDPIYISHRIMVGLLARFCFQFEGWRPLLPIADCAGDDWHWNFFGFGDFLWVISSSFPLLADFGIF